MSRPLRIEYPDVSGAWYHVMNRGRRGEEIFRTSEGFELLIKLSKESQELWKLNHSGLKVQRLKTKD